jgi:Domain of Unknown Function (DUF1080)
MPVMWSPSVTRNIPLRCKEFNKGAMTRYHVTLREIVMRSVSRVCVFSCIFLWCLGATLCAAEAGAAQTPLFDGKTFTGWEGNIEKIWRIEDGMLVAGSLSEATPRNEFLATTASYKNFILRLDFKLEGTEGFLNSGVQIRSVRVAKPANEMSGYQVDIGKDYTGSIYDESRRNKTIAKPDADIIKKTEKVGDWNHYEIRCQGPRIVVALNGVQTVDFVEADASIPLNGKIAVQIHGGGKAIVRFRNLTIVPLAE